MAVELFEFESTRPQRRMSTSTRTGATSGPEAPDERVRTHTEVPSLVEGLPADGGSREPVNDQAVSPGVIEEEAAERAARWTRPTRETVRDNQTLGKA